MATNEVCIKLSAPHCRGRLIYLYANNTAIENTHTTNPAGSAGGGFLRVLLGDTTMATKTQYRVVNLHSWEVLSEWTDSEIEANKWRLECEEHETQPECRVVYREIDMHEEAERVEAAYRAAGLMQGPCGVVVRCSQFGVFVADDQHTENYDDAEQAIADLDSWRG